MSNKEAIAVLVSHIIQRGMMMPVGWLKNHGEGSDFETAMKMAMDAL